jgi:general secretion pathway protein E
MSSSPDSASAHPLLAALEERGLLDEEQGRAVLQTAERDGLPLDRAAVHSGLVPEADLLGLLGEELGLRVMVSLKGAAFSRRFVQRVPVDFARRHAVVGLEGEDGAALLATATALRPEVRDAVAHTLGEPVEPVLAPEAEIADAVTAAYQEAGEVGEGALEEVGQSELARLMDAAVADQDLLAAVESAPVVQLVNKLLFEALRARASDVHVQPTEQAVVVRYRIDGVLHQIGTYPTSVLEPVVSRVKVMARMDITERRLPQDGRATVRLGNKSVDLRVSTVPSNYGERVVIRLLDRSAGLYGLEELGLSAEHLAVMDRVMRSENGIFFCTGPTGSGKTTTLYAALSRVDSNERNVITLEDPIEYHLPGITQLPVTEKKGMSFASGLRSILRQDPDVVMVGEVRDVETARMAVRAAQTGHLVLSTLHTNDSAGAVARLLDLDVEPFLLASCLTAVLAQRLVRRVCPHCAEAGRPPAEQLLELGLATDAGGEFRRGTGCDECLQTGYYGRLGLFELLVVDDEVRRLILERADATAIREAGRRAGLTTLREDGARKAAAGLTTCEEVLRVTQADAGTQ